MYATKSELQCKVWTWVNVMCQCRLVGSNKHTTLVGGVNNGGGWGVYAKSIYLPLNFAVNLKLI